MRSFPGPAAIVATGRHQGRPLRAWVGTGALPYVPGPGARLASQDFPRQPINAKQLPNATMLPNRSCTKKYPIISRSAAPLGSAEHDVAREAVRRDESPWKLEREHGGMGEVLVSVSRTDR